MLEKHLEIMVEILAMILSYDNKILFMFEYHINPMISFYSFVLFVWFKGVGMMPPFVNNSEDWSVFTINDSLNFKIGKKNEF